MFLGGCQTLVQPQGVVYHVIDNTISTPGHNIKLVENVHTITIYDNNVVIFDRSIAPEYPDVYSDVLPENAIAELIGKMEYMVLNKLAYKVFIYDQPVQ